MGLNVLAIMNGNWMWKKNSDIIAAMDIALNKIFKASKGQEGLELLKEHSIALMLTEIVLASRRDMEFFKTITSSGLGYIHKPFSWRILRKKIKKFNADNTRYVV